MAVTIGSSSCQVCTSYSLGGRLRRSASDTSLALAGCGSRMDTSLTSSFSLSICWAARRLTNTNPFSVAATPVWKTPLIRKARETTSPWVSRDVKTSFRLSRVSNFLSSARPTTIPYASSGFKARPRVTAAPIKDTGASFSGSMPTRVTPPE